MICTDCIHKEVCGKEGAWDEALIICKDKTELPHNTGHWIPKMKLIIEISEGIYKHIDTIQNGSIGAKQILNAVKDGVPAYKAIPTIDIIDDIKTEISMYENHDESADEMVQGIKSILLLIPNKVGHWIKEDYREDYMLYKCSECGYENVREANFCENCGSKMEYTSW